MSLLSVDQGLRDKSPITGKEIFTYGGDYGKDVIQLEQRLAELAASDAARTKKLHERHAATPEH